MAGAGKNPISKLGRQERRVALSRESALAAPMRVGDHAARVSAAKPPALERKGGKGGKGAVRK